MKRLGDILIDSGFLTAAELAEALSAQQVSKKKLGEVIVDMGLLTELDILRAISSQYDTPIIDLQNVEIDPEATKIVSEQYCVENTIVPIGFEGDRLLGPGAVRIVPGENGALALHKGAGGRGTDIEAVAARGEGHARAELPLPVR